MSIRRTAIVLSALLVLLAIGCTQDDSDTADTADDATATSVGDQTGVTVTAGEANLVDDDGRSFSIVEVGVGDAPSVVLENFTGAPARLTGLYLCSPAGCVALPDLEVPAGERAPVPLGDGDGGTLQLRPTDGEVGLYASEDTGTADDVRAYVQWGSTPHEGTPTAIEAGQWIEGAYVETTPDVVRIYRSPSTEWLAEPG